MRLSFINAKGYQPEKVDSPFFRAADQRWMLSLNNKVHGPYNTKEEAVAALQTELLIMQGVR